MTTKTMVGLSHTRWRNGGASVAAHGFDEAWPPWPITTYAANLIFA